MKKEDKDFCFTPSYKVSKPIKITDNVITNDDITNSTLNPTYYSRSNPDSSEFKREESIVKSFFSNGFGLLNFKPYNNYHIAIRALEAYCGFVSNDLKFNEDLSKTANDLICCCFLFKFIVTISNSTQQGREFLQSYSIDYENKLLWIETRWRVRYYSNMYKFKVVSGSQNPPSKLQTQIFNLLYEIKSKFPRLRAEDLFFRVLRIAESTKLDDGL